MNEGTITRSKGRAMESDELIGSTLGQYQVLERLGEGGMARVYKGMQQQLNRYVALKIILPEAAERPGFQERFKREAQLVAQLQHANIVTVYDFGETKNLSYLVMQYVGGGTLSSKLKRGQPLRPALAVSYGVQMARALQHAHSQGIIHRDIKPSNMLLDEKDLNHLLLSDFGIAKLLAGPSDSDLARRAAADPLTVAGSILGTPEFMAPEQALGAAIDARADVYSLGMVLYFLLVGKHPFPPTDQHGMLYHHVYTTPQSASAINPAIPPMLAEVVAQAIAKRPEERFQSAEALARALESVLAVMQNDEAPTRLAQLGPTVLAPDASINRSGWSISGAPTIQPTPQPTPAPGGYTTNPQPFTASTTPGAYSPSQPGGPSGMGGPASGRAPSFHSAPTPLPGQPPAVVAPQPPMQKRRPRLLVPGVVGSISLLLVAALVLALIPGSPLATLLKAGKENTGATPTATQGAQSTQPVNGPIVDMFNVNTLGWPSGTIASNPDLHPTVGNGVYRVTVDDSYTFFPMPSKLTSIPTNFTLEIKVRQVSGSETLGYGLIFRESEPDGQTVHCYAFTISSQGQFQFISYPTNQPYASYTANAAILSGPNQVNDLQVKVTGQVFKLSVNGTLLPGPGDGNTWSDNMYTSGNVGLLVTGPATYEFTYFALTPMS
jgi:serine/threonine protein kinase